VKSQKVPQLMKRLLGINWLGQHGPILLSRANWTNDLFLCPLGCQVNPTMTTNTNFQGVFGYDFKQISAKKVLTSWVRKPQVTSRTIEQARDFCLSGNIHRPLGHLEVNANVTFVFICSFFWHMSISLSGLISYNQTLNVRLGDQFVTKMSLWKRWKR